MSTHHVIHSFESVSKCYDEFMTVAARKSVMMCIFWLLPLLFTQSHARILGEVFDYKAEINELFCGDKNFFKFKIDDCGAVCFRAYQNPMTFAEANRTCGKLQSGKQAVSLFWLSNPCEHYLALLLAGSLRSDYMWIGLNKSEGFPPRWMISGTATNYFISNLRFSFLKSFAASTTAFDIFGVSSPLLKLPFICRQKPTG